MASLRMWVVDFNISHAALRALLAILRKSYKDVSLPKDARTVMKTPRSIETFKLGEDGAEHWHQGLATCLNMHYALQKFGRRHGDLY